MVDNAQVFPAGHNRGHILLFDVWKRDAVQTTGTGRETVDVSREETRNKDWLNKLKGKTYADDKRGAVPKSIRVSDAVLLKAEKSNKLSSNFHPSPFKVIQKTGSEVTVRNDLGVEFKRNTAFVKKYNVLEDASAFVSSWLFS